MRAHAQKRIQPQQASALHPSLHTTVTEATKQSIQSSPDIHAIPYRTGKLAHAAHDLSKVTVFHQVPVKIQKKLRVNTPGDSYEQEADSVAERVMRMPKPALQGDCACGGECPKCKTNQAEQQRNLLQAKYLQSGDAEETEAPPVVHEVLNSVGQPLDPQTRAFMEPRFGHDFSHVRVHSGVAAEQSARGLSAHAYTVGHNIVFGAGRFAPATHEGRRLLAHELTHVVQQSGARGFGDGQRTNERRLVLNTPSINGVIAWQPAPPPPPDPGWSGEKGLNKSVTMVDEQGNIQPGKDAEKAGSKGVWRVPVEGLSKGLQTSIRKSALKGRAIALIPNIVSPVAPDKEGNVSVDVLFHMHGYGAGYRELDPGEKDYAEVLKPGQLRDVELYQMEQQLLSHVKASKRLVIAVLPQGSDRSNFGNLSSNSDAYLKEVFDKLAPNYLPKGATPGRVIVSGHSGGGPPTMAIANQRAKAGKPTDVLLFDAINSACTDKKQATDKDGKPIERNGKPVMECKEGSPCASNRHYRE